MAGLGPAFPYSGNVRLANCAALAALLAAACATGGGSSGGSELHGGYSADRPGGADVPRAGRDPLAVDPADPDANVDPADAPLAADPSAEEPYGADLGLRLAERARLALGHRGAFVLPGRRFPADCSGYVSWVYEAEGVPLRSLMVQVAPRESSGVAAAYQVFRSHGIVFGGGGEWPRPGDIVFFRDTYDRNRNGKDDDPFTHAGLVESVDEAGTVTFLHRERGGVRRGVLTLARPTTLRDEDGKDLNTVMRNRNRRPPTKRGTAAAAPVRRPHLPGDLAGALFQGYGRIGPRHLAPPVALR